ncbi:hypothetical protein QR680_002846 [Steinernema hermaphroditum]|uniref:EF-hand domain-containing protein n=1 Tax=Steinernema hermaphroditum TaxID=289476 RepID=A0AA39H564_9BILA|nr:hypothetical protein QR680_002846 [Steinernema hermaphroditum]
MISVFVLLAASSLLVSAVKVDPYARRELHVLFQKADANNDRFLDKKELTRFVDTFTRRVPRVYKGVDVSQDTLEGARILAEELFKRADKFHAGRLSYKGSLLAKSDATNFGELAEKVIINLVHEVNEKPSPYLGVNPFSNMAVFKQKRSVENQISAPVHD